MTGCARSPPFVHPRPPGVPAACHRNRRFVEPSHVDIEELAPIFGRLLALGTPTQLKTDIGERGFQRLLGAAGGVCHFGRHAMARCRERLARANDTTTKSKHCKIWVSSCTDSGR